MSRLLTFDLMCSSADSRTRSQDFVLLQVDEESP